MKSRFSSTRALSFLAFWLVAGISLTGCERIKSLLAGDIAGAISGQSTEDSTANSLIGYFNLATDDFADAVNEYVEEIPEGGPKAGKKYDVSLGASSFDIDEAKESLESARSTAPDSLEKLVKAAEEGFAGFRAGLAEAEKMDRFYSSGDYKSDADGAKAKAFHDKIIAGFTTFRESIELLDVELSKVEDKKVAEELKEFEEDSYGYWIRFYPMRAKKVVESVGEEGFAAAFASHTEAYNALQAFAEGKGTKLNDVFKIMVDESAEFYGTARDVKSAMEAGKESKVQEEGNNLISHYNNIMNTVNTIHEIDGNGLLNDKD